MSTIGTYIATDPIAIFQALYSLQEMGTSEKISAILLDGPPGVGKTYLGKHLARKLKADLIHFQIFPGCDRSDMLWDNTYASSGNTDGILIQAIKKSQVGPIVLILDELDKADVRVDSFLLNFLNEGFLMIPSLGVLRANSANLLVVITKNDQRDAAPPLLRRCRAVYMDWPTVFVETQIIQVAAPTVTPDACASLLAIPNRLRINPEVIKPPSTQEVVRLIPNLLDLISRGVTDAMLGEFYISSIAQNPKDRRFIEKSPLYIGLSVREALANIPTPPPPPSLMDDEITSLKNE